MPLWPPTPGELALCILLFILFFALSWGGLVLWDEVFINTSDTAADTVHAVLTGAGRMAVSSAVLAVAAVYIGKAIVITAKFFARRLVPALRQRPGSTGKLSTPWKSTWPGTAVPGFLKIEDHGNGSHWSQRGETVDAGRSSSPDSWGGRPHFGAAHPYRSRRRRQTTRCVRGRPDERPPARKRQLCPTPPRGRDYGAKAMSGKSATCL